MILPSYLNVTGAISREQNKNRTRFAGGTTGQAPLQKAYYTLYCLPRYPRWQYG
jgi:hypothetical protein